MNYTQAQIDRANAVSLEDFLRTQGETLIKSGREYRWKEHDSLTVRGNKWFRHSQSKGGYPIDFVMEFYGKSFPEAVQMLTGESGEGQTEATTAPPTAFHLPLHNRTADRAIQYLCESRGLNPKLVEAFLLSGDIYEDAKRHNVVFVGRDRSGTPRYAHVRGTADPFRQDIAGSDKSYPFRYEGNGNQLFVFEAPIDLLSFICLYPQDWQTRSYLALGGVSGKALDRFLSERKDTRKVFLCLDSDTAGSEACSRLAQDIPSEIAVIRLVPATPFMLTRLLTFEELNQFDAVFVSGGDVSVLCREMSRTGFDRILNNAIKNGLIYVGISAGSMYAAGNLTDGLHIIDNPIIPHWNGSETTVLPNGKDEIKLADGKAVYVEDNYMSVI